MLRFVGAGLPRTGTESLKLAIETLLGGPCYHMLEVFGHPDHIPLWHAAVKGGDPAWETIFEGFVAAVDWPASAFWHELAAANPDAVVVLSTRADAQAWWRSVDKTVAEIIRRPPKPEAAAWHAMATDLSRRFLDDWGDPNKAMAAYEAHNDEVRKTIAPGRLVDWRPGDGWAPLCDALGVAVPGEPFPHANSTEAFRQRAGFDAGGS